MNQLSLFVGLELHACIAYGRQANNTFSCSDFDYFLKYDVEPKFVVTLVSFSTLLSVVTLRILFAIL